MTGFEKCMEILSTHELEDLLIESRVDMTPFFECSMESLASPDMTESFLSSLSEAMDDFSVPDGMRETLRNNVAFLLFSLLRTQGDLDLGRMVNDLPGFVLFSAVYAFLEDNADEDPEEPEKWIEWYYLLRTMHLFLYREESDEDAGISILSNSSVIMRMLSRAGEWRRVREIGNDTVLFADDYLKKYPESDEYRRLMTVVHYALGLAMKEGFDDTSSFLSHMRDTVALWETLPDDMKEALRDLKEKAEMHLA